MQRTNPAAGLLDELATGVARLDAHLCIAYANPAFAECTGIAHSRIIGQTLVVLKPGGERLHAQALQAQLRAGTSRINNMMVCAAPGREARLDFAFVPATEGILVEVHPAAAPGESTRVSESLRGFAHEVRNPLAAIGGAAQLLERGATSTRQRELAELIVSETTRLAALSERLLGARATLATRAVNVHALLERVAELMEAERTDVTVARDYDPSLPAWHGDPDRLLQALLNLARNAVEAHATRVVLRSRAEAGWRDARGQRVPALRLEVEDDGEGVPTTIASTLFDPMVSGRADGTGLGLALAREIAREHGGDLSFEARTAGTCFMLRLPRHPHTPDGTP